MKERIRNVLPTVPVLSYIWSVFLLFLLSFAHFAVELASAESVWVVEPEHVLHWILSHPEAAFNDKQQIRRIGDANEGDSQAEFAVYAVKPIQKDEVLFQVPWDLILSVPESKPKVSGAQEESGKEVSTSDDEGADEEDEDEDGDDEEEENSEDDHEDEPEEDIDDDEILVNCDLVKLLQKELYNHQNGQIEKKSSMLGPYLNYINFKTQTQKKVPSTFTEAGKDLFVDLLLDWASEEERDKYRAPPVDSIFVAEECSAENSDEEDDDDETLQKKEGVKEEDIIEASTTMWVVQKADSRLLVPLVHDIYPHDNGVDANNTKIQWKEGEYYQVVASRDIKEGEILKHSLNLCTGCLATEEGRIGRRTYENYGTEALFRDYGFIQDYPQTWLLDDCSFEIDLVDGIDDAMKEGTSRFHVDGKDLQVTWIPDLPPEGDFRNELIKYLFGLYRRLVRSKNRAVNLYHPDRKGSPADDSEDDSGSEDEEDGTEFEFENPTVPLDEWDAMLNYLEAITDAVAIAHNSLVSDQDSWVDLSMMSVHGGSKGEDVGTNAGNCVGRIQAVKSHYDDLKAEGDGLDYITPTCSDEEFMQFKDYEDTELILTPYQEIKFHSDPNTGDICMNSNSTLQICTSYRPQYNEMMVHYPARFVESIKRVLIVGGGNSMLLHEVLEYSSLKKVVVLELDQTITRKSFKHFQVQPHFDDNRVEWFFGEVSKSLLHLLHGQLTFDLIVFNYPKTYHWDTIVRGFDIFATLALLLHEDGVLVRNGRFIDQVRGAFDYGVQVHFEMPKVCSQTMVFASKSIDFLHHDQEDHEVSNHFLLDFDEMDDQFDYMHDYYTSTSKQKCTWSLGDKSANGKVAQVESYGIFGVLDIENISKLNVDLKDLLQQVARSAKFHPISSLIVLGEENGSMVTLLLLEEGYISTRLWASERYLAVGVNLWNSYNNFALFESKLLKKLGTKSKSSFQILVGGMGYSVHNTVLEPKQTCESLSVAKRTSNVVGGRGTLRPVLTEVLNLIHAEQIVAGVACGFESSGQPCMAKEVLEANPRISQVIVLWTCPDLQTSSDSTSNLPSMSECERNLLEQLDVTMDEDGLYFDMFVVDNSTPLEMAQIFNSIWSNPKHREWYLTGHFNVFLGISLRPPAENYHRQMLDRYRRHIRYDPINRAELLIEIDGARMEVDVVSAGDLYAFYNLHVIESRIQKKIGSLGKVEVRRILGGQREYKEENDMEEFAHDLYDQTQSVKQYRSQKPLGRENIFQYRIDPTPSKLLAVEKLTEHVQQTLEKMGLKEAVPATHQAGCGGYLMTYNSQSVGFILVWNGANTINVNLFSLDKDVANDFLDSFQRTSDDFSLSLYHRDDYPRGTGRVVNFPEDITPLDNQ